MLHVQRRQMAFVVVRTDSFLPARRHANADTSYDPVCVFVSAGFKGGANWAVAQEPPQLSGLHKKNSKKLLPKET